MVYPALLPLMRTPRLPVVDWPDAPADWNGLGPFRRKTKSGFCTCAITFQLAFTSHTFSLLLSFCYEKQDLGLPSPCKWDMRSFGILRSVWCYFLSIGCPKLRLSDLPLPCFTVCHHSSTGLYRSLSAQLLSGRTVDTHTHTHTHIRTYLHTYVQNIHTYIQTNKQTNITTHIHTDIHTYLQTYIHTYIHACIHTYVRTYIHTYIHIHTYTYTHTHTYTHTVRQIWLLQQEKTVRSSTFSIYVPASCIVLYYNQQMHN